MTASKKWTPYLRQHERISFSPFDCLAEFILADLPHVIAGFAGVVLIQYRQGTFIFKLTECPYRMIAIVKVTGFAINLRY